MIYLIERGYILKLLQISVTGLPLFKDTLNLDFFATQRVSEKDTETLFQITPNLYLNCVNAFVGINASGKTTVLKTILLAMDILQNKPINHIQTRSVLGESPDVLFEIVFSTNLGEICKLKTNIHSENNIFEIPTYSITSETLYIKHISKTTTKKIALNFSNTSPALDRSKIGADFLPDDVSIIIAYNKKSNDSLNVTEMLFLTDINLIPFSQVQIPLEIIEFLDPSIKNISVLGDNPEKAKIVIEFKNSKEITVEKQSALTNYLSSGTIKGISIFIAIMAVLAKGGYYVIDELENHFNKEIVATIIRIFMDPKMNPKGAVLIYSSHYPELLDEHNRNDSIFITKKTDGIYVENLSTSLQRNDIKKSDAFQSGYLEGTTPAYNSYIKLKNYIKKFVGEHNDKTL